MAWVGDGGKDSCDAIGVGSTGHHAAQVGDAQTVRVGLGDVAGTQAIDRDKENQLVRLSEQRRGGEQEAKSGH